MMKRRVLFIIMSVILIVASGCGQKEDSESRDRHRTKREKEGSRAAEGSLAVDVQELSAEDHYAIYERFLAGEEPIYFGEDTSFDKSYNEFGYQVEAGRPYELYEICNIINMVFNGNVAVNELSDNISYAYIDCGADGDVELALLFHDLYGGMGESRVMMTVKNVDGRLKFHSKIQYDTDEREQWDLNEYGLIVSDCTAGASAHTATYGYINGDGMYNYLYTVDTEYDVYREYPEIGSQLSDKIPWDALAFQIYSFAEYSEDMNFSEYLASRRYSLQLLAEWSETPLTEADSGYKDILDNLDIAGMELYSYEEIQEMVAAKEAGLGVTEEIKNGSYVEWIPVDEKHYDLIYGVESAPGVSDKGRAIEAYRRFLSDKGHFKEVLSQPMGDGLEVNNNGMVDGFFIKDLDYDDIPELLIGMSDAGRSQYVFIYKFDKESGRVKYEHIIYGLGGRFECEKETYDTVVTVYPEFADSLLFTNHYVDDLQQVGFNDLGQLVWFENYVGISIATDIRMFWCDYENLGSNVSKYTEDGGYNIDIDLVYYEVTGSRADAENALQGYRPILFYDINEKNINRYVVEDYLGAGMERYSQQDVTDDMNQFYRTYEEYARGEKLMPTGEFFEQYGSGKYNIEYLVQFRFY